MVMFFDVPGNLSKVYGVNKSRIFLCKDGNGGVECQFYLLSMASIIHIGINTAITHLPVQSFSCILLCSVHPIIMKAYLPHCRREALPTNYPTGVITNASCSAEGRFCVLIYIFTR